ncbi:basic leucine zipper 23-like [Olea europaea var. sylvestris]|uniref:Basic leucine zipper 23-like n=1 Tax=Olea europaea subsp. europaea TaxID=158383 RepID=A0A8S0RVD5_OLEEU|nr:basic leucine zipper 23-like [Olea europaea var. sylvestris]XP_022896674.1 basic leucine zipper 23-like [Olea europaea var. sylvestris]CAA2983928.1 basic leucine zipper 23-like [Olea europaea subsp. europaea]
MNKFSVEMDNGELDQLLSCLDMVNAQASCSFDIDEFLSRTEACNDSLGRTEACTDSLGRTQACTHAHACKTVGPDNSHTHTCYHIHTQVVPAPSEVPSPSDDTAESVENKSKKRPVGNREAVRKYREKKKARAASLEDEVVRLRALNQQLMKRLQGQALLEAEIARLKCLLVDFRGRIEGEIGAFPYQKPHKSGDVYQYLVNASPGTYVMNPCNTQQSDQLHCLHPGSERVALNGQSISDCGFDTLQCLGNQNSGLKAPPGCDIGSGSTGNTSKGNRRKGGARAATAS